MKRQISIIKHMLTRQGALAAGLFLLLGLMISPASAQLNSEQKYIFVSGQLTSSNTGAPIPDHQIYITSDSLLNNGFSYYSATKTDVNGFYWDTLVTTATDGVLSLYVYDFDNNKIALDRYYRFVWENDYMMFADFAIFNPDANTELQANFTSHPDPIEENPMKIIFEDESIGESVKSWLWNFGDGTTSEVQDPEHVYIETGVYRVSLTINALPGFQGSESSTITKQVQVGLRENHNLGGHVFGPYFPIDLGLAYLYIFDEFSNLIPLDTAVIDTFGYYNFMSVPAGKYLTKARLQSGSELYGQYIPTYYGDVYDWVDAEEIVMNDEDNWAAHINLIPSSGISTGDGEISGLISYDTSMVVKTPVPAEDVEIVLLSQQGALLTCGLSSTDGSFGFDGLAYGTYQMFPDVAGVTTTPMYVTLSADGPLVSDISLVIFPGEITFSINENNSAFVDQAMLLYPNPVTDQARISFEVKKSSSLTVMITDLSGRMIFNQDWQVLQGTQEILLPVGELPAGVYQVLIIPEDKVMISGKFLKAN
jgi:PKD repeat protein